MSHLHVDFVRLQEAHTEINAIVGALNAQLQQLTADAAPLVSTWSGEAQQAYRQRQQAWESSAAELERILRSINRALEESMLDYQSTEAANAAADSNSSNISQYPAA